MQFCIVKGRQLDELKNVLQKGGSLCMYDIELEAGIVMEAMRALQLPDIYLSRWHGAAIWVRTRDVSSIVVPALLVKTMHS